MALPAGLEPATSGLENRCSIQLSYGSNLKFVPVISTYFHHVDNFLKASSPFLSHFSLKNFQLLPLVVVFEKEEAVEMRGGLQKFH